MIGIDEIAIEIEEPMRLMPFNQVKRTHFVGREHIL